MGNTPLLDRPAYAPASTSTRAITADAHPVRGAPQRWILARSDQ